MKKILKCIITIILILVLVPQTLRVTIYKKNYSKYVENAAKTFSLDEHIIYSIIKCESNFKENVISNKGAKGLMQLMDSTSQEMYKTVYNVIDKSYNIDKDILKPELNIILGTAYLKTLMTKYGNNLPLVSCAYNAGMGNVDNWIKNKTIDPNKENFYEDIPFPETKEYVIKVIRTRKMYDLLYS